jgi:hypothetical protein
VAVAGRAWGLGREAPWAARARGRVAAARGWMARRWTVSRAALARPLAPRLPPAAPAGAAAPAGPGAG